MRRIILISIVLFFLFGGMVIVRAFQTQGTVLSSDVTSGPTATPTLSLLTPQDVTMAFYKYYLSCMKNPPKEVEGHISSYCQASSLYTTNDFLSNLEKGSAIKNGIDPIFCSQNQPRMMELGKILIQDETATIHLVETFGSNQRIDIPVSVQRTHGNWKIHSILCQETP